MSQIQWYPGEDDDTFAFVKRRVLTDGSSVFDVHIRTADGPLHMFGAGTEVYAAKVVNALNAAIEERP